MNWHKCDVCGCYLDPGEGRTCDDCMERQRRQKKMQDRMSLNEIGQYEMELEELYV